MISHSTSWTSFLISEVVPSQPGTFSYLPSMTLSPWISLLHAHTVLLWQISTLLSLNISALHQALLNPLQPRVSL